MKNIIGLTLVAIVALALTSSTHAQQSLATAEHQILNKDAGTWIAKGKMWMPNAPDPLEFEGVETNEMIGELWLVTDFQGNFAGFEFRGHGRLGYDIDKKMYVGTWFDLTNPYVMHSTGSFDEKTNTMTFEIKSKDPTGKDKKGKSTMVYKDADTRVSTTWTQDPNDASEMVKEMEITYTRKK